MNIRSAGYVVLLELLAFWGGFLLFSLVVAAMIMGKGEVWGRQHADPAILFAIQLGLAAGTGTWLGRKKNCPNNRSFLYGSIVFASISVLPVFSVLNTIHIVAVAALLSTSAIRNRNRGAKAALQGLSA